MLSILQTARELRGLGLSVVPVIGKRPAIAWDPYTKRHPTAAELQEWFSGRYARLAVVTGRVSGVVVLDCDGPEAVRFVDERLPATPMRTRTPRAGEHRYYNFDRVIGNRVAILGLPLDLRGEKAIAVAYGSGYERLGDWAAPRPTFDPAWLPADDRLPITTSISAGSVESLWRYISQIASISGQRGHASCFRCACRIADYALAHSLTYDECLAVFAQWNETCALPRWSLAELNHKLTDAINRKGTRC